MLLYIFIREVLLSMRMCNCNDKVDSLFPSVCLYVCMCVCMLCRRLANCCRTTVCLSIHMLLHLFHSIPDAADYILTGIGEITNFNRVFQYSTVYDDYFNQLIGLLAYKVSEKSEKCRRKKSQFLTALSHISKLRLLSNQKSKTQRAKFIQTWSLRMNPITLLIP